MHPVQYVDILEIHLQIHAIRVFTRIYIKYMQIRVNTRIESKHPQIREQTPPLPGEHGAHVWSRPWWLRKALSGTVAEEGVLCVAVTRTFKSKEAARLVALVAVPVLWSASLPTTDGYPCRYSLCLRCRSDDAQVAPRAKQTRNRAHALICNCKIPLRVLAAAGFSSILVGRLHQPRRHDGTNVFALSRDVLTRASPGGDLVRQWLEDLANYTRAPITTRRARMRAHSQPGLLPACGSWRRRASSPRDTRKRSPRGLRWVTTFAAQTSRMSGALRRRGSPLSNHPPAEQ